MAPTKQSKPTSSTSPIADAYSAWLRGLVDSTLPSSPTSPQPLALPKTPLQPPTFGKRANQPHPGPTNTNTPSTASALAGSPPKPQPALHQESPSPPQSLADHLPSGKVRRSNSPSPSINSSPSPQQSPAQQDPAMSLANKSPSLKLLKAPLPLARQLCLRSLASVAAVALLLSALIISSGAKPLRSGVATSRSKPTQLHKALPPVSALERRLLSHRTLPPAISE